MKTDVVMFTFPSNVLMRMALKADPYMYANIIGFGGNIS
jgi:hypothetical protein